MKLLLSSEVVTCLKAQLLVNYPLQPIEAVFDSKALEAIQEAFKMGNNPNDFPANSFA